MIELTGDDIVVRVDPTRGAEIASVVCRGLDLELLARTPWAERADAVRPGALTFPASASPDAWMEAYSGGWQVLFPHAGAPEEVDGVVRHYHGEASTIAWAVDEVAPSHATLHVVLATVPARITRTVVVTRGAVEVADVIENLSGTPLEFDYVHHPAFGEDFLGEGGRISTSATRFTSDPSAPLPEFEPGSSHTWPMARDRDDSPVDLATVPTSGDRPLRFGYLDAFDGERWVAVENAAGTVRATLSWSDPEMAYAWFWQQVRSHPGYPWFGRGYVVAVEPSTAATSGPARSRRQLGAGLCREFRMTMSVTRPGGLP